MRGLQPMLRDEGGSGKRLLIEVDHDDETRLGRADHETSATRVAAWLNDWRPRVNPSSNRTDWFYVLLLAGPCLAAVVVTCLYLLSLLSPASTQQASVPAQHTLKAYVVAQALADREMGIVGVIAAAYPLLIWVIVKMISRGR